MRNRFDEQLMQLNNELITMGALCEEAIESSVKYLSYNDENMKEAASGAEKKIDEKERNIESLCMKLLMQQQPVASDLRLISSALKMISDMERIGDQASDIAEIVKHISGKEINSKAHIEEMAQKAIGMVTGSVDSFVKKDTELAKEVIKQDNAVDALFDKVKDELIQTIRNSGPNAETSIDALMIAKYLERIGDHAENIAEWVIYSVTGNHEVL